LNRAEFEAKKQEIIRLQKKLDHERTVNQVILNEQWSQLMAQEPKELPDANPLER
jgi:hypothetical protein